MRITNDDISNSALNQKTWQHNSVCLRLYAHSLREQRTIFKDDRISHHAYQGRKWDMGFQKGHLRYDKLENWNVHTSIWLHVSILTTSHMEKLMVEQLKYKTQLKFRRQSGLNLHPLCSNKVPLPNISTNIGYM
jgi:hypothetical protein